MLIRAKAMITPEGAKRRLYYGLLGEILEAEIDPEIVKAGFKVADSVYHQGKYIFADATFNPNAAEGATIKLLESLEL